MNKQRIASLFALMIALGAQAQTWLKVETEGSSAATSPVIVIAANTTYRFGSGTKWCASVTPTVATSVTVWYADMGCADPAPGVVKELDLLIPPIVVPPVTPVPVAPMPVKNFICSIPATTLTYSLMSDGSFQVSNPAPVIIGPCRETL